MPRGRWRLPVAVTLGGARAPVKEFSSTKPVTSCLSIISLIEYSTQSKVVLDTHRIKALEYNRKCVRNN